MKLRINIQKALQSRMRQRKGEQNNGKSGEASQPNLPRTISLWSNNPSKQRGEKFYLIWSIIWILFFGLVVVSGIYEKFDEFWYMILGLVVFLPAIILPLLFPGDYDSNRRILWRYTTKANVWIFILSFIGNYLWTHYFYVVLGTKYTFPSCRLNDVPIPLILITHSYFCTYHVISNLILRRLWRSLKKTDLVKSYVIVSIVIILLSWFIAFLEAFSIQQFPYYTYPDRYSMYVYGSIFYGIYFIVSFPMFFRLDEKKDECWPIKNVALDSFACCMIVTLLLDFWRISIGNIHSGGVISQVPFVQ